MKIENNHYFKPLFQRAISHLVHFYIGFEKFYFRFEAFSLETLQSFTVSILTNIKYSNRLIDSIREFFRFTVFYSLNDFIIN